MNDAEKIECIGKKKYAICAICGKYGKMSDDHIPPKCCGNNSIVYFKRFIPEYLSSKSPKHKLLYSQNGIKFKYICGECNNLLGSKYDDELGKFKNAVLSIMDGKKDSENIDMIKVIKSIIGHFLAASERNNTVLSKDLRKAFFEDDMNDFYKQYSLFLYYYPYKDKIFILKEYAVGDFANKSDLPKGMLSSIYFYPFAFIISDKRKDNKGTDLLEFVLGKQMLRLSNKDWMDSNGKLLEDCWPAVVNDYQFVVASKAAKDSIFDVKKDATH